MVTTLETADESKKMKVKYFSSSTRFKFGIREHVVSSKLVILPSEIAGGKLKIIETEVVNCDLPLLISKDAMKKEKKRKA